MIATFNMHELLCLLYTFSNNACWSNDLVPCNVQIILLFSILCSVHLCWYYSSYKGTHPLRTLTLQHTHTHTLPCTHQHILNTPQWTHLTKQTLQPPTPTSCNMEHCCRSFVTLFNAKSFCSGIKWHLDNTNQYRSNIWKQLLSYRCWLYIISQL